MQSTFFRNSKKLVECASSFVKLFCTVSSNTKGFSFANFKTPKGEKLNTINLKSMIGKLPPDYHSTAIDCYNSFNKGPQRSIIFMMMLDDLRTGRIKHKEIDGKVAEKIYSHMEGSYQSPKVLSIYCQQSFGNPNTLPIDTWIETFLKWPLNILNSSTTKTRYEILFNNSSNLGKLERLLWITSQARKVHSSICDDILWCTKYGNSGTNKTPRGANPLACKICNSSFRNICPAFERIKGQTVTFNQKEAPKSGFDITTSKGNLSADQSFVKCRGESIYCKIEDDFSTYDNPAAFASFPKQKHIALLNQGKQLTVEGFINMY